MLSLLFLLLVTAASLPVRHSGQIEGSQAVQELSEGLKQSPRASWMLNEDSWNYWWSYSGVSGPSYWGLLNSDWFMCEKGQRQSPIDLNTKALVFDPNLTPLRADNNLISGVIYNDGHSIVFNASLAAVNRFAALESAIRRPQEQTAPVATTAQPNTIQSNGERVVTKRALNANTSPSQNQIFTLDDDSAEFVIVNSDDGFVVESGVEAPMATSAARIEAGQSAPMLMRELSNNIDLSISESDRLDSFEAAGHSQQPQQQLSQSNPVVLDETSAVDEGDQLALEGVGLNRVHFSGGALAYSYRFESLQLKFGTGSESGSEHRIDGRPFAAELQLFAYNWQLYKSVEESLARPYGLMAVAILIDTFPDDGEKLPTKSHPLPPQAASNEQLDRLLSIAISSINYRGTFAPVRELNLSALLPNSEQFVTYEGSLTQPSCHESVIWLILNRPLYISKQILERLRSISADEQSALNPTGTLIAGNTRPIQPANRRPIRTNIRPAQHKTSSGSLQKANKQNYPNFVNLETELLLAV